MTDQPVLVLVPDASGASGTEPRLAGPDGLHVRVTDLGITRGDGVFETIGVFAGRPVNVRPHLERLQRSATMLDMGELDLDLVGRAIETAIEEHADVEELMVRVIVTRGNEPGLPESGYPSGWVHAKTMPSYQADRREGIDVVTLDRGLPTTAPDTSPWLLAGAKSLSYAINMAALREAARRGASDVLFVASDGYVLEAPTATLLVRQGERLITTPPEAGVLPGTAQRLVFETLRVEGRECVEELLTPEQVATSDGAWLVASGRLATPIRRLDDRELAIDHELTDKLGEIIAGRSTPAAQ
ncbi:MAG: aminotransferase class IV [Brachybacterium sp.]|nr:aminotransferase class IV [Brachybacterium sp.]